MFGALDHSIRHWDAHNAQKRAMHTRRRNYRYQIAIRSIGNIIQYYNTSHQFAGYGFGALIPPDFKISHCFPLNNNPANPFCDSVDELLDHYKKTIENVKLSGPTCFARIVDNAAEMAKNQEKNSYSVLLIITGKLHQEPIAVFSFPATLS